MKIQCRPRYSLVLNLPEFRVLFRSDCVFSRELACENRHLFGFCFTTKKSSGLHCTNVTIDECQKRIDDDDDDDDDDDSWFLACEDQGKEGGNLQARSWLQSPMPWRLRREINPSVSREGISITKWQFYDELLNFFASK